jgi:hypothetical protein
MGSESVRPLRAKGERSTCCCPLSAADDARQARFRWASSILPFLPRNAATVVELREERFHGLSD